jgi:hypothetical protein
MIENMYKVLNIPSVPEELLDFEFTPFKKVDIGYGNKHFKNGKELIPCLYSMSYITHTPLVKWIEKNLPGVTIDMMRIQAVTPGTHIVHSDLNRLWSLIYVIETGGDAVTSWYKENGKSLSRTKTCFAQSDTGFVDYNDLTVIDSVKIEKNQWALLRVDVLHDVDNITSIRKGITISFYPDKLQILDNLLKVT